MKFQYNRQETKKLLYDSATYINEAKGDLIRFPSRHNFNKAKPRCLSAFQPNADTSFKTFGGNDDNNKCTDPILNV